MNCFCPECGLELNPNQKYGKKICQVCGTNIRETWRIVEEKERQQEEENRRLAEEQRRIEEANRLAEQQRAEQLKQAQDRVKYAKQKRLEKKVLTIAIITSVFIIGCSVLFMIITNTKLNEKIEADSVYLGTLAIGTKTQIGGTVIYDKGDYTGGWRYIECSEPFAQDSIWSLEGQTVENLLSEIGDGEENTWKIIHEKGIETAAGAAMTYSIGEEIGWYLPNAKEAELIAEVLKGNPPFWISEMDEEKACYMDGSTKKSKDTATYTFNKTPEPSGVYVVAVRKF